MSDYLKTRTAQFRDQVARRLSGALTEDEFRPLRLMNGVYLQLHAYMLRVAIPYGTLNPGQMRALADLAERWDKGYGHFTTRQNIQYNWPRLTDIPDMLDHLAGVGLHAIQTSGNCVRNVTSDHFAGAAPDEAEDPRPWAELLRIWSTDHPEFAFLPRKFKIAITGAAHDRAATRAHDIGLRLVRQGDELGFEVAIGGGLGRTPLVGQVLHDFLPAEDLLPFVESILAVYNALGRRDNKYKARIKIAVQELGMDHLRGEIAREFEVRRKLFTGVDQLLLADLRLNFAPPALETARSRMPYQAALAADAGFRQWADINLSAHRHPDHAIVTVTLKTPGDTPGDASAAQMRLLADLAETYGHGDLRISHEQNVILPHVHRADLPVIHAALVKAGLASANAGLISDIVACPGLDYCALATARSIPVAQAIATRFEELRLTHDIGPLKLRISGCINACAHHHLGHIGILGLDRAGVENYQITLGGDGTETTVIGERAGPGFSAGDLLPAIERVIAAYLELRTSPDESFLLAYRRLGNAPFKAALYPEKEAKDAA